MVSFHGRRPSLNPEDAAAVRATLLAVQDTGADLGLIFDPDVDRIGVVLGAIRGASAVVMAKQP